MSIVFHTSFQQFFYTPYEGYNDIFFVLAPAFGPCKILLLSKLCYLIPTNILSINVSSISKIPQVFYIFQASDVLKSYPVPEDSCMLFSEPRATWNGKFKSHPLRSCYMKNIGYIFLQASIIVLGYPFVSYNSVLLQLGSCKLSCLCGLRHLERYRESLGALQNSLKRAVERSVEGCIIVSTECQNGLYWAAERSVEGHRVFCRELQSDLQMAASVNLRKSSLQRNLFEQTSSTRSLVGKKTIVSSNGPAKVINCKL